MKHALLMCLTLLASSVKCEYFVETEYGNEADEEVVIFISRTNTVDVVNFKVQTQDGTALAPLDYTSLPETALSFPAGSATASVTVTLVDDGIRDPAEYFVLSLTEFDDGSGSFTADIFIADSGDTILFCPEPLWAKENDGGYLVNVTRDPRYRFGPLTVNVATQELVFADESPFFLYMLYFTFGVTEAATEDEDFMPVSNNITFENGELTKTLFINLKDDFYGERTEAFYVVTSGDGVLGCLIRAIVSDDDVPDYYHCSRGESQPCRNGGTCNPLWGFCDCPEGYGGPDCRIEDAEQDECDERCGEHGWCRSTPGEGSSVIISCECFVGWTGEYCNYTAYNVQCNPNSFGICLTPYSFENFSGTMYVYGNRSEPQCQLELATDDNDNENVQSWCAGYRMELPFNGPCGDFGPNEEDDIYVYRAGLVVQYIDDILTGLDEYVVVTCKLDPDNVVLYTDVMEVAADPRFLKKQTSVQGVSPAILTVRTPGVRSSLVINRNQRIEVCASVKDAFAFDCLNIKKIEINNTRAGLAFRKSAIYEEGCIARDYRSVFLEEPGWIVDDSNSPLKHSSCFDIYPFVFPSDIDLDIVYMGIQVTVSLGQSSCTPLDCITRKKRSTEEEEEVGLGAVIAIDISSAAAPGGTDAVVVTAEEADPAPQNDLKGDSTSDKRPMIIGGVTGAVVMVTVVGAIVYLTCRRRGGKHPEILYR